MGCCSSRHAVVDFYTDNPTSTRHRTQDGSDPRTAHSATAARPNKPLRSVSPVAKCPAERALQPWTRAQLEREREMFFETRVTGDPQVWAALRLVCEMLRHGDTAGAQSTFDSVGLTSPTGRIKSDRIRGNGESRSRKGGIFDEKGHCYEIPGWIMADPGDLAPDESIEVDGEKDVTASEAGSQSSPDQDEADRGNDNEGHGAEGAAALRRIPTDERVTVKARLSDRGTDIHVEMGLHQKVKVLVRRVQQEAKTDCSVKLIYLGKQLNENKTLAEQGWQSGHVVSVFVFE